MPKIMFNSSASDSGAYELTYNPVEIDAPQARASEIANSVDSMDGESITFNPYFDTRRGSMTWRGYPGDTSTTLGAAFETQLTTLEGYVGDDPFYMHFKDLGDKFGVYATWTAIKIIAVNKTIRSGAGTTYDPVTLVWENAEV